MNTEFADEKKLLLAEWQKAGITGNPTDDEVILFAVTALARGVLRMGSGMQASGKRGCVMSEKTKLTPAMQRAYEKARRAGTVHDLTVWKWTPEYKSYVPIKTAEALVRRGLLRCVGQQPISTGSAYTFNVYEVIDVSEEQSA